MIDGLREARPKIWLRSFLGALGFGELQMEFLVEAWAHLSGSEDAGCRILLLDVTG